MDEGNFKCDTDSNVRHPITEIERPKCRCGHDKLRPVTLVSAVLAVFAVCVSMYVMYTNDPKHGHICVLNKEDRMLLEELRSLKAKLVDHQYGNGDAEQLPSSTVLQGLPYVIQRVRREAAKPEKPKKPKKHKKKKRCPRHCRKRGKRGPVGPPGPRGPRGPPGIASAVLKNRQTIKAAHFMPDFLRDRTHLEKNTAGIMNFFHPAKWIEENEHITSPVELQDNGEFLMKDEGLYLLYSSVSFNDDNLKESHALTVNGTKLFRCIESVDFVDSSQSRAYNAKYKTCSITGVTYLKKWHRIAVENLYNTTIDLTKDVTFFGLVQLVPGIR